MAISEIEAGNQQRLKFLEDEKEVKAERDPPPINESRNSYGNAIHNLKSDDVMAVLMQLFIERGIPDHIRSDNGSEFTSKPIKAWLASLGVRTLYIEPGSPWENGYNESFNGRFRDEFLKTEAFYTLKEAEVLTAKWLHLYNHIRPHSSLGYKPPAPLARSLDKGASAIATAPLSRPPQPQNPNLSAGL